MHPAFGSLMPSTKSALISDSTHADVNVTAHIDAVPTGPRRVIGLLQLTSREPATVYYDYNAATKKVEAVKERIRLGAALLELEPGPKPLTGSASARQ
jgi:hypothetical protein